MSSQIVEREICGYIKELQEQGRHMDAALLDMAVFHAKGYLPELCEIRDNAEHLCGGD